MNQSDCSSKYSSTFETIAENICEKGFCIIKNLSLSGIAEALLQQAMDSNLSGYTSAKIGRAGKALHSDSIRSDKIRWITGDTTVEEQWLLWSEELKSYLNQKILLGLFSFESHFAAYCPGTFYQKHRDAFRGQANRVLSIVYYLNRNWQAKDGGELLLYSDGENHGEDLIARVQPELGTLVTFLSEEFPHEVLPAKKVRHSIAGWYRLNNSTGERIDPPQ